MPISLDARAVETFRIPAHSLKLGDLVNTAPGGEDDWQEVTAIATKRSGHADPDISALIDAVGDRYVYVEMSDIAPVDSNVYFENGEAFVFGVDSDDQAVADVVSEPAARRNYLYTVHELVTVRLD